MNGTLLEGVPSLVLGLAPHWHGHPEARLRRHAALAPGVGAADGAAAVRPISLMIALGGHVRHSGRQRLDLGHEVIPLARVARGVGEVAHVQDELEALTRRLHRLSDGVQDAALPRARLGAARLLVEREGAAVDGEGLYPMVLSTVDIGYAHVREGDEAKVFRSPGRRRHTEVAVFRPTHGVGAHNVEHRGAMQGNQGSYDNRVEPAGLGPAMVSRGRATELVLEVGCDLGNSGLHVAARRRSPQHRRCLVAEGRRPTHAHRVCRGHPGEAQVLRRVDVRDPKRI
mmetsp:Transcript_43981/g.140987  ORF Transcript_43981/g.140987 Transcript_43981/m.140987 type:complete len:285 (+) Transcript_43981:788-1642(+)